MMYRSMSPPSMFNVCLTFNSRLTKLSPFLSGDTKYLCSGDTKLHAAPTGVSIYNLGTSKERRRYHLMDTIVIVAQILFSNPWNISISTEICQCQSAHNKHTNDNKFSQFFGNTNPYADWQITFYNNFFEENSFKIQV